MKFIPITLFLTTSMACGDYDYILGVSDTGGDSCASWYYNYPETCGNYDDEFFVAGSLCCACGGGIECVDTNYY